METLTINYYEERKVKKRNDNFGSSEQQKMAHEIKLNLNERINILRTHSNLASSSRTYKSTSPKIRQ